MQLDVPHGEEASSSVSVDGEPKEFVYSFADAVDVTQRNLPTINPVDLIGKTFLKKRDIDGTLHCAEVLR